MSTNVDWPIDILISDPASMEKQLDRAVEFARTHAMKEKTCGILVTRHTFTHFTVGLSDSVPFGMTIEHWNA
jgi:hypothetical protein